ncbi:hypothetical protein DYB30_009904, partial [Aphanomyces astaci]
AQLKKAVMEVCNWYEEKNKLEFQGKRPLEEEDIGMHDLLWSIQGCLQHGLREDLTACPSAWLLLHFIKTTLTEPSNPIGQAIDEASKESSTDAGRIRYWIRHALNQSLVEPTLALALLASNEQFLRATYDDNALLRCQEGTTIMTQLLSYLKELAFNVHLSDREFSRRRTSLPNLSGVLLPPSTSPPLPESRVDVLFEHIDSFVNDVAAQADEFLTTRARSLSDREKGIKPWQHAFDVELSFLVKNPYHTRYAFIHPHLAVPNFLVECLAFLKMHAATPRLFRTTVSQVYVAPVKDYIESHGKMPSGVDPHVASAVLLDFLRHIPEPLVTSDKFDAFVASSRMASEADGVRNLTCLVADLPVEYKVTMEVVFGALAEVLAHAEENGLTVVGLSIALAPAIVRKREMTKMQTQDVRMAAIGAHVVELLLLHHTTIFQEVRDQIANAHEEFQRKQEFLQTFPAMLKQPVTTDDAAALGLVLAAYQRQVDHQDQQLQSSVSNDLSNYHSTHVDGLFVDDDVALWQSFGFRESSIAANFTAGGQLLLHCVAYFVRTDATACQLLADRVHEYNMGEALAALALVLLNVLKLAPTPDQPVLDFTLLSMEPFWDVFGDPVFFTKLFVLAVRVFDYNWSMSGRPEFGRILEETEAQMTWLLQRSPSSVEELVDDWLLYRKQQTQATSPTLLLLKEDHGTVFGGFASDMWQLSGNYHGNGSSFLFRFTPLGKLDAFTWSRKNNYFQLCSDESLVMGGGNAFGLYLDADLVHGTTGKCDTFGSNPLVPGETFSCTHVEVWGFTLDGC